LPVIQILAALSMVRAKTGLITDMGLRIASSLRTMAGEKDSPVDVVLPQPGRLSFSGSAVSSPALQKWYTTRLLTLMPATCSRVLFTQVISSVWRRCYIMTASTWRDTSASSPLRGRALEPAHVVARATSVFGTCGETSHIFTMKNRQHQQ
jgi:hypothetical protein